jgi:hypothetical protein
MARTVRAPVAAAVLALALVMPAAGAHGQPVELPLFVFFVTPVNGSQVPGSTVNAVVAAGGATAAFQLDTFENGSFVNAWLYESGVGPNATMQGAPSSYTSAPFEHPAAGTHRWSEPLDIVLAGSAGPIEGLLNVSVRLGARAPAHDWSPWFEVGVGGDFEAVLEANASLLARPALQYRVEFLDPTNASTPRISLVEAWYLAPAAQVEARVGPSSPWLPIGQGAGQFAFNATLSPGANLLEARVTDTAGAQRAASVSVTLDHQRPTIEGAPENGTLVAVDRVAQITFSEPIDPGSAAAVRIEAPFTVDRVWTGDGTRLLLSAAAAPSRGEVTVTIGPGLTDRAGNRFNETWQRTYTMGPAPQAAGSSPLLAALLVAGVAMAAVALWHLGRLKEQRIAYAREVAKRQEALPEEPPAPGAPPPAQPPGP